MLLPLLLLPQNRHRAQTNNTPNKMWNNRYASDSSLHSSQFPSMWIKSLKTRNLINLTNPLIQLENARVHFLLYGASLARCTYYIVFVYFMRVWLLFFTSFFVGAVVVNLFVVSRMLNTKLKEEEEKGKEEVQFVSIVSNFSISNYIYSTDCSFLSLKYIKYHSLCVLDVIVKRSIYPISMSV